VCIEGNFRFYVTLLWWRPWRHYMQTSAATWRVNTKHLMAPCSSIRQFLIYSSFVPVISKFTKSDSCNPNINLSDIWLRDITNLLLDISRNHYWFHSITAMNVIIHIHLICWCGPGNNLLFLVLFVWGHLAMHWTIARSGIGRILHCVSKKQFTLFVFTITKSDVDQL